MVTERQILKVRIEAEKAVEFVKKTSKRCEYAGPSSVYTDKKKRKEQLPANQLTGQLGEYATMISIYNEDKYIEKINGIKYAGQGDGGNDIPGAWLPIDVKSSNVNVSFNHPGIILNYRRLMVSKIEYSPNAIYIGCALEKAPTHEDTSFEVWVMGWALGSKLKWDTWTYEGEEKEGFRLKYGHLQPMSRVPNELNSWWDLLDITKAA